MFDWNIIENKCKTVTVIDRRVLIHRVRPSTMALLRTPMVTGKRGSTIIWSESWEMRERKERRAKAKYWCDRSACRRRQMPVEHCQAPCRRRCLPWSRPRNHTDGRLGRASERIRIGWGKNPRQIYAKQLKLTFLRNKIFKKILEKSAPYAP